jgi:hypothetical protein
MMQNKAHKSNFRAPPLRNSCSSRTSPPVATAEGFAGQSPSGVAAADLHWLPVGLRRRVLVGLRRSGGADLSGQEHGVRAETVDGVV